MKVGVSFPVYGGAIERHGIDPMLTVARESGIEGLWAADHLAVSSEDGSRYPGSTSGEFFLDREAPWYEPFTTMGYLAAGAGDLELGFAVALASLRPPVLVAKQTATLARLARGPVVLGVGAGWMRAEFEAMGVPFGERGRRLEDGIRVMRECWSGEPEAGEYGAYVIPKGLATYPTPPGPVPILVGGASSVAFARAARVGDGWIGMLQEWQGGEVAVAEQVGKFRAAWAKAERPDVATVAMISPLPSKVTLGEGLREQLADRLAGWGELGVNKVILSISWRDLGHVAEVLDLIAGVTAELRANSTTGSE